MKKIKNVILGLLALIVIIYLGLCGWFYFKQEKALFNVVKLPENHVFQFRSEFKEVFIPVQENVKLHGVLFKAANPKGLILWLPGGRGMIDSIGIDAHYYTDLNYDLFVLNYRGFGKSGGKIESEEAFNRDMQAVYDHFKKEYTENKIVVFGFSLGTGPAATLAANNTPKLLILRAPYYSMRELGQNAIPYLPVSLLQKYEFPVNENLRSTKCPVVIFHGDQDKKIPITVSYRLKEQLKPSDKLIILKGQGHDQFEKNGDYLRALSTVLE